METFITFVMLAIPEKNTPLSEEKICENFFLISKRNIIKKRKAQSSTHEVYKKGI